MVSRAASDADDFRPCPLTQHLKLEYDSGSSQSATAQNRGLSGRPDFTFGRKPEGRSPQGCLVRDAGGYC